MTKTEKLQRDIETLRDGLQNDWIYITTQRLSVAERNATRAGIDARCAELSEMLKQLWAIQDEQDSN